MVIAPKSDLEKAGIGTVIRLIGLFNVKLQDLSPTGAVADLYSSTLESVKELRPVLVQWLPEHDVIEVDLMMPSGQVINGLGESHLASEVGNVVQLMRVGFGRVEAEQDRLRVYFAHR